MLLVALTIDFAAVGVRLILVLQQIGYWLTFIRECLNLLFARVVSDDIVVVEWTLCIRR